MNITEIANIKNCVVDLCQEMISLKATLMEHEQFFCLVKEMRMEQINCSDAKKLSSLENKVDIYLSLKENERNENT